MSETDSSFSDTLHRWLNENVADTRSPDGPEGRVYTAPFAAVWDEVLRQIRTNRGWGLAHQDEELGIITITCTTRILRMVDDLTVWVSLDANGLTVVDARSASRKGKGDLGTNRRRVIRLFEEMDEHVGARHRVRRRSGRHG